MRFLWIILLILSLPASALGTTFTLYDQFPISQGVNDFYAEAYRYDGSPPAYRQITKTADYQYYTIPNTWDIPYLVKHPSNGWIYMHPVYQYGEFNGHEDAVLAWNPGNTVAYELDISGSFQGNNSGYKVVYIKTDTELLWSSGLSGGSNVAFNLTDERLNPGETLYFGVNNGNNSDTSDETLLRGTIDYTAVPVPGTLSLTVSGLVGLWGWRRFR